MKRILLVGFLGVFVLACHSEKTTNPHHDITIVPLTIGNEWTYEITEYDSLGNAVSTAISTMAVARDTTIEGEKWYDFAINGGSPLGYLATNRSDGYWSGGASGHLQYKYPAAKDETYMFYDLVVTVEATTDTVTVPCGSFVCHKYRFETPGGNAGSYSGHYVVPGIGLVKNEVTQKLASGETYVPWCEILKSYVIK